MKAGIDACCLPRIGKCAAVRNWGEAGAEAGESSSESGEGALVFLVGLPGDTDILDFVWADRYWVFLELLRGIPTARMGVVMGMESISERGRFGDYGSTGSMGLSI